jgi:hypothetical protein
MLRAEMNRVRSLIVLVVVALVCAGVAIAAGGSSGQLHACASKRTGALRLLSHGKCKRSEREVSWNVTGPPGKQGLAGKPGTLGSSGHQGATGAMGATGATGANGTARAYAHVIAGTAMGANPTLDASATKGFTSVAYGTGGQLGGEFCLVAPGIDPAHSAPVVSAYYDSAFTDAEQATVYSVTPATKCPAADFQVFELSGGEPLTGVDFDIVVP